MTNEALATGEQAHAETVTMTRDQLAAHDREVAAKAWNEGHGTDCDGIFHSLDGCERVNPYRADDGSGDE